MARARGWIAALALALVGAVAIEPSAGNAAVTGNARVAAGSSLNVRSGPSTSHAVVRKVRNGAALSVTCQVAGQSIRGSVRTTAVWDKLSDARYVSDAYVAWRSGRPRIVSCANGSTAQVSGRLNLRPNASTLLGPRGTVKAGGAFSVACQLGGESVAGTLRTSWLWDRLPDGHFVSDAYVAWPGGRPAVPWCTFDSGAPPASGAPFVNWAGWYAQQMKAYYPVPASVTTAQAILESGWGTSGLSRDGNNYFGMKCFTTPGTVATGCRPYSTNECANDSCYATNARFRVYANVWNSFADHAQQLSTSARYRSALQYVNDPDRFATEIHRAGYATSPTYASNLINLMRQHNLYRFDMPA